MKKRTLIGDYKQDTDTQPQDNSMRLKPLKLTPQPPAPAAINTTTTSTSNNNTAPGGVATNPTSTISSIQYPVSSSNSDDSNRNKITLLDSTMSENLQPTYFEPPATNKLASTGSSVGSSSMTNSNYLDSLPNIGIGTSIKPKKPAEQHYNPFLLNNNANNNSDSVCCSSIGDSYVENETENEDDDDDIDDYMVDEYFDDCQADEDIKLLKQSYAKDKAVSTDKNDEKQQQPQRQQQQTTKTVSLTAEPIVLHVSTVPSTTPSLISDFLQQPASVTITSASSAPSSAPLPSKTLFDYEDYDIMNTIDEGTVNELFTYIYNYKAPATLAEHQMIHANRIPKIANILVFGKTGHGKSSFIVRNSL